MIKVIILVLALSAVCSEKCQNIPKKRINEMQNCAKNYWKAQEYPRNPELNKYVINCFNEKAVSAPFGVNTTSDKNSTLLGFKKVSTNVIDSFGVNTGPFFENNTKADILSYHWGCDEDDNPHVFIRVLRHFYSNFTAETMAVHYVANFQFVKSSDSHKDPSQGSPDYTIIYYVYQPYTYPMFDIWPGVPLQPDKHHFFYACLELRNRCGNINWSPYSTCVQWLQNKPYISHDQPYSPNFIVNTGYCVMQLAFFGITNVRSNDPNVNLCPYIVACTGNF